MKYIESKEDLFLVDTSEYWLAHCISADFKMGAGVAKEIVNRYSDTKQFLFALFGHEYYEEYDTIGCWYCIPDNQYNIMHLITKRRYYEKPTLYSMRRSLKWMKAICESRGIKKVAMPKIGCGLDRLNWDDVRKIIMEEFNDCDIEIKVCYLE